jgi:hypothetical protein
VSYEECLVLLIRASLFLSVTGIIIFTEHLSESNSDVPVLVHGTAGARVCLDTFLERCTPTLQALIYAGPGTG